MNASSPNLPSRQTWRSQPPQLQSSVAKSPPPRAPHLTPPNNHALVEDGEERPTEREVVKHHPKNRLFKALQRCYGNKIVVTRKKNGCQTKSVCKVRTKERRLCVQVYPFGKDGTGRPPSVAGGPRVQAVVVALVTPGQGLRGETAVARSWEPPERWAWLEKLSNGWLENSPLFTEDSQTD